MRTLLLVAVVACTPPPKPPASTAPAPTTSGPPAPAGNAESKVGYMKNNGRCPGHGVMFSDKADADPVSADGRICVLFPALENLAVPDDAKHDAFQALLGKHVKLTFTKVDEGTIQVTAVESVP